MIDYPRDVQPIWDKHCVKCHCADKPDGRVLLTGDYNDWFSHSYYALFASQQVSDSEGYAEDGNRPARGFGSAASPLMGKLDGSHYDAKLSDAERRLVQLWIDTGATYPGTYAAPASRHAAFAATPGRTRTTTRSPTAPCGPPPAPTAVNRSTRSSNAAA